jgi:hypothetical protein
MADEKKIIIDEDWKSQVAAEKAQQEKPAEPPAAGPQSLPPDFEMPPASWELLLTTLATEAMIGLGLIPHPATGQPVQHRNQAKYLIDVIEMLRDKSKGNLTPGEAQLTESMLHQLRMAYVGIDLPAGAPETQ